MAAHRRVYDSRHLQADCQAPGSAPEPYARQSSMGCLYLLRMHRQHRCSVVCLLDTTVSPTKTDEPIEVQFGVWTCVGPKSHVLCRGPNAPRGRGQWSFCKLGRVGTLPVCFSSDIPSPPPPSAHASDLQT